MSIDRRQYAIAFGASSASASPTFASAVLVGSTIIVAVCSQFTVQTITDNKGNSYAIDAAANQNGSHIIIARAFVVTGGSGLTVTATTGTPGPITMSVEEVPNVLIVDQTNAGAAVATSHQITLTGRFAQTQDVYAAYGACVQNPGTFTGPPLNPWRMISVSGGNSSQSMGNLDASFSWNSTSGALIATGAVTGTSVPALITLCMAAYIERVTADFSGTPTTGVSPLSVTFTDSSTGTPTNWLWEFGDNTTSGVQNPVHVYGSDGTYTVRLTAWNVGSTNVKTRTGYIVVDTGTVGGGGTPTTPGIPNNDPGIQGYPPMPFLGAPWSVLPFMPKRPDPVSSEPTTASTPPVLIASAAGSAQRAERSSRLVALVMDALERGELTIRGGEHDFSILGGSEKFDSAPTTSHNEDLGWLTGAAWVQDNGDGTTTLYLCFDGATGDWRAVGADSGQDIGGLSGVF